MRFCWIGWRSGNKERASRHGGAVAGSRNSELGAELLLALSGFVAWQDQVQHDRSDRSEGDPLEGKRFAAQHQSADTEHQSYADNHQVSGNHQVHLAMYQGVQTHGSDGAKQQAEDAAHHGNGNRLESRTELAYKGQQNRAYRCPGHHPGIEVLGQYHGAGHFRVGRIGGTAHHGRGGSRQTISQEGAVQAGLLDEVLAGDRADHHYIPNMFDHRGNGDRNHKQDGGPLKGGGDEVRHGQPGSCSDLGGVYDAEREGQAIADGHAEQDGQQSEDTPSQNRDDDGREQGGTGNDQRSAIPH